MKKIHREGNFRDKDKSSIPLLIWTILSSTISISILLIAAHIFIVGSIFYIFGIYLIILINTIFITRDIGNKYIILGSIVWFILSYFLYPLVIIGCILGALANVAYIVYILVRKIKHLDVKRYSLHLSYMIIFILLFNVLLLIFSSEVYAISMKAFFTFKRDKFEDYIQSENIENLENEGKITREQDIELAKLNTQCVIKYNDENPTIILFVLSKNLFNTRGVLYTDSDSFKEIDDYLNDESANFKFTDNWYYLEADIEYR